MRTLILFVFLVFLSINTLNAQSKYLDSTRTAFSASGEFGFSEDALSISIGSTITLKGALDLGIQIGKVKTKKEINSDNNSSLVVSQLAFPENLKIQKSLFFEPGVIYENEGQNVFGGLTIGLIL